MPHEPYLPAPRHYDVWDCHTGDRSVINQYDILQFDCLAELLYREWQDRIPESVEAEMTELEHPGVDGVTLAQLGKNAYLLMRQDRSAHVYVGAFGVSGTENHLDDYAVLLKTFQRREGWRKRPSRAGCRCLSPVFGGDLNKASQGLSGSGWSRPGWRAGRAAGSGGRPMRKIGWRDTGTLGYYRAWYGADLDAPEIYTDSSIQG